MIKVRFPIDITGDIEYEICNWVGENFGDVFLSEDAQFVEFDNEEIAIYFRLKFGI